MSSSDDEIDAFIKEVHSGNSEGAVNVKLLIGSNVVLGVNIILFGLKGRDLCDTLPNVTILRGLDSNYSMRKPRRRALINQSLRKKISFPNMKVPELAAQTFDD